MVGHGDTISDNCAFGPMVAKFWREGKHRVQRLSIRYESDTVILPRYPFPARATRRVATADIVEVIDWISPAIRTVEGEFLCVRYDAKAGLHAWSAARGVPVVKRYDAWADLLDPFLDTEFTPEDQRHTLDRLAAVGLNEAAVMALRERLEKPMIQRTVWGWEWIHYGLADVLDTMKPLVWTRGKRWRAFYDEAMAVAARGCDARAMPPAPP